MVSQTTITPLCDGQIHTELPVTVAVDREN